MTRTARTALTALPTEQARQRSEREAVQIAMREDRVRVWTAIDLVAGDWILLKGEWQRIDATKHILSGMSWDAGVDTVLIVTPLHSELLDATDMLDGIDGSEIRRARETGTTVNPFSTRR